MIAYAYIPIPALWRLKQENGGKSEASLNSGCVCWGGGEARLLIKTLPQKKESLLFTN